MVKASDWLHCPFDSPALPSKKTALGQQGKAVGCVPPTALLFARYYEWAGNSSPL